jgi:hypothetical protein
VTHRCRLGRPPRKVAGKASRPRCWEDISSMGHRVKSLCQKVINWPTPILTKTPSSHPNFITLPFFWTSSFSAFLAWNHIKRIFNTKYSNKKKKHFVYIFVYEQNFYTVLLICHVQFTKYVNINYILIVYEGQIHCK